jgi:hypothetical protein
MPTHNTLNRHTSMPLAGFEPTISASERPQTYALDSAATGIGIYIHVLDTVYVNETNYPQAC